MCAAADGTERAPAPPSPPAGEGSRAARAAQTYRLTVFNGSGLHTELFTPSAFQGLRLELATVPTMRPCSEPVAEIGLTVHRCPSHTRIPEAVDYGTWQDCPPHPDGRDPDHPIRVGLQVGDAPDKQRDRLLWTNAVDVVYQIEGYESIMARRNSGSWSGLVGLGLGREVRRSGIVRTELRQTGPWFPRPWRRGYTNGPFGSGGCHPSLRSGSRCPYARFLVRLRMTTHIGITQVHIW